jgi:hypothetical protein
MPVGLVFNITRYVSLNDQKNEVASIEHDANSFIATP